MKRGRALFQRRPWLLLLIAAGTLSVGSSLITSRPLTSIGLIAVAAAVGILGERLREKGTDDREKLQARSSTAEAELAKLYRVVRDTEVAVSLAIELSLEAISNWVDLDSDSRVSFYHSDGTYWQRIGRYSSNLEIRESGRIRIEHGEGALSKAYSTGEFSIDNLPSPESDLAAYLEEQKSLGVQKSQSKVFVMRSRSYFCIAFGREIDRSRPFAVLFESIDPNGLDTETLRTVLQPETRISLIQLAECVESLRSVLSHLTGPAQGPVVESV